MVVVWKMQIVAAAVVYQAMYLYKSTVFWQLMVEVLSILIELNDWILVSNVYLMSPAALVLYKAVANLVVVMLLVQAMVLVELVLDQEQALDLHCLPAPVARC
jgi:hypothetical protein